MSESPNSLAATTLPPKSIVREYVETIVVCVIFLIFARSFVFMQSKIPTGSMEDTLLVGDYIMVNRFLFGGPDGGTIPFLGQRPIERGDVIVFRFPRDPDTDYVKRVIGLPGETVEVTGDGRAYVDGRAIPEDYVQPEYFTRSHGQAYGPRTLGPDEFFTLGDHRNNSRDSRYWGIVPRSLIKGRAFFIWYSYKEDRNDHQRTGSQRLQSMAKKVLFFPTRTRWDRIFSIVH